MTLTTPLDMPPSGPAKQTFELQRVDYLSPQNNGRVNSLQVGSPLWSASYTLGTLGREGSDAWRAFAARLRGSQRWFYGRDYDRPYPRAYPAGFTGLTRVGGGAFDGSATSWSQSIDGDGNAVLVLNGLPAAFALGLGDYVGFRWGAFQRALVRAVTATVGSGSLTIMVDPAVPALVPSGAVAYLNQPVCLMKKLPGQTPLGDLDRKGAVTGTIAAIQDLQP